MSNADKETTIINDGSPIRIQMRGWPEGIPNQVRLGISLGVGAASGAFMVLVALHWLGKLAHLMGLN